MLLIISNVRCVILTFLFVNTISYYIGRSGIGIYNQFIIFMYVCVRKSKNSVKIAADNSLNFFIRLIFNI